MSLIKHQAKCASHMRAHGPESQVGHLFFRNNPRKNGCCLVLYGRVLTKVSEGPLEERPPQPVNAQNLTCVLVGTATAGAACQRRGSIMALTAWATLGGETAPASLL